MMKEKTGTQLNQAHASVDDYNTKKYVLPLLRDEKTRNRLIEEHRACPVGRAPQNGQEKVEHSLKKSMSAVQSASKGFAKLGQELGARVKRPH